MKVHEILQSSTQIFIVSDYIGCGLSLTDWMMHRMEHGIQPLKEFEVKYFAYQLLSCLEEMHKINVFHGNICSDKIIIENDIDNLLEFKLIDFGTAGFTNRDTVFEKNKHTIKAFTPPEIANGQSYNKPVDVWGTIALIFLLLLQDLPFKG